MQQVRETVGDWAQFGRKKLTRVEPQLSILNSLIERNLWDANLDHEIDRWLKDQGDGRFEAI